MMTTTEGMLEQVRVGVSASLVDGERKAIGKREAARERERERERERAHINIEGRAPPKGE
jgi:hypothetical protein